ncbi:DUF4397 domain-containing protein [Mucilaginibacter sp. Bleaf8]|uniref:DUF4397 domain-containing protein n=1 Tax=Mucilaginibacter sp. Bleaf8 TaxID=2834430 RepID=UPI001BCE5A96|nr:DUF4397 domain-containing protein [Mucilaginibacter sp. Bleaf8]MBS7564837.1 DUF4397 domain-containing protein [Mucilaginibacter sp. Bleaf8]
MKTTKLFVTAKRPAMIMMVCMLAVFFSSCLKNNDNDYAAAPARALVSVVNASPGSQALDFYLDQNKANNQAMIYGDGIDYIQAYTGKRTATFYLSGTQQKIKSDTLTLQQNQFYTLYLTNMPAQAEYFLVRDSINRPAAGKATIRLVNVSPNAPAVDLAIKNGAVLATNKSYKSASAFIPVNGNSTYTFEIRQAGTNNVLVTLTDVKIKGDAIYTVWLQGLNNGSEQTKLNANIQNNVLYY